MEQRGVRDGKRLHGITTGVALGKFIGISISISAKVTESYKPIVYPKSRAAAPLKSGYISHKLTNIWSSSYVP